MQGCKPVDCDQPALRLRQLVFSDLEIRGFTTSTWNLTASCAVDVLFRFLLDDMVAFFWTLCGPLLLGPDRSRYDLAWIAYDGCGRVSSSPLPF